MNTLDFLDPLEASETVCFASLEELQPIAMMPTGSKRQEPVRLGNGVLERTNVGTSQVCRCSLP